MKLITVESCLIVICVFLTHATNGHESIDKLMEKVYSAFSHVTRTTLPKTEIGAECYTHQGNKGYCDLVSSCPPQFRVLHRLNNAAVYNYFSRNICRKELGEVFFCCPEDSYIPSAVFTTNNKSEEILLDHKTIMLDNTEAVEILPINTIVKDQSDNVETLTNNTTLNSNHVETLTNNTTLTLNHDVPEDTKQLVRSPFLPSDDECGTYAISTRVIGGTPAKFGSFPWLGILGKFTEGNFHLECGATIISSRYVISCNCFLLTALPTHVRVGDFDYLSPHDGGIPRDYSIIKVLFNQYVRYTEENDIALIKVDREITFNDYTKPACLPFNLIDEDFTGKSLKFTGRGYRLSGGTAQTIPFEAEMTVVGYEECKSEHQTKDLSITDKVLCLNTTKATTCQGDCGSPFNYLDKNTNKWVMVAIDSSSECELGSVPSTATKIAPYLEWIMDSMDE